MNKKRYPEALSHKLIFFVFFLTVSAKQRVSYLNMKTGKFTLILPSDEDEESDTKYLSKHFFGNKMSALMN